MKHAKIKVGELVQVPTYRWSETRKGMNGYHFAAGVITKVFTTKSGELAATVEYRSDRYGQEMYNIKGEPIGFFDRVVVSKNFYAGDIFAYTTLSIDQEIVNKAKREEYCGHTYTADQEFLIDKGFLKDNK